MIYVRDVRGLIFLGGIMNILAIDCATEILSVALEMGNGEKQLFSSNIDAGHSHSEKLLPVIDELLKQANIAPADIDLFLCQRGPGSWTGLRIGFAAVKGLSFAFGKPYISIPSSDLISNSEALENSKYGAKDLLKYYAKNAASLKADPRSSTPIYLGSQVP
jgi:tRNA threonylcarbamoyl adenosine modification protein YeaZ